MFLSRKQYQKIEECLEQLNKDNNQLLEYYQSMAILLKRLEADIREVDLSTKQQIKTVLDTVQKDADNLSERHKTAEIKFLRAIGDEGKSIGKEVHRMLSLLLTENQNDINERIEEIVSKALFENKKFYLEQIQAVLSILQTANNEKQNLQRRILTTVFDLQKNKMATIPNPLFTVELHVVEHCNLNCKMCSHFSCIAEEEYLEATCLERDMARLTELFDCGINRIRLLGGEPLLHPQLPLILEITRKYFPKNRVEIVTNGIALAEQPGVFWETCRRCQIVILCTEYPISVDYRQLEKLVTENGVTYLTERIGSKNQHRLPLKLNQKIGPENSSIGRRSAMENFCQCFLVNVAISLYHGKVFPCAVACNIRHFNRFFHQDLPVSERDYIDIHKVQSAEEVIQFLARPIPFCQFCDVPNRKFDFDWGPTERNIKEWSL